MHRGSHSLFVPSLGSGVSIRDAVRQAQKSHRFNLYGANGGSLAPFLVHYQSRVACPIVLVTSDERRARYHALDLSHHLAQHNGAKPVLHFPGYDTGPYSELASERMGELRRSAVAFETACLTEWRFIVLSIQSLIRRITPKSHFLEACLRVDVDDRLDRDGFIRTLTLGNYYPASLVEEPGTFAARGSLIDLFPPYLPEPVRIDLFGSQVDNIRTFDPVTQKSGKRLSSVWVHPCRLNFRPRGEQISNEIAKRIRTICDAACQPTMKTAELIDDILGDHSILGMDRFSPAFYENRPAFSAYLPNDARFCIDAPDAVEAAHRKTVFNLKETYAQHLDEGKPAFSPDDHVLHTAQFSNAMDERPTLFVRPLETIETSTTESANINADSTQSLFEKLKAQIPPNKSHEIISIFSRYLNKLVKRGYRVGIITHTLGQADRLAGMLRARKVNLQKGSPFSLSAPGIAVSHGEMMQGCILPGDGVAFIAEEEVFGRRTRRTPKRTSPVKSALFDLKHLNPGDLVVHRDHGIGKYEGLIKQEVRGAQMAFLLVTYRDQDKLYLPIYRLNQIQKYRGGNTDQRLDKLGGQTFAVAKKKAKQATEKMAAALLDLYAKRQIASREPFKADDDMYREFEADFPFEETPEQARAIDETMADLSGPSPMDRLVCGDVGFGKTEIAMRAAFRSAISGFQTAVLVPTTVLSQQHYQSFSDRFSPYPINVGTLSRFASPKENKATILALKEGRIDVVIGTHRLLSKDVHFKNLGLLIIDEEHRFGVTHKERIRSLRTSVDTLVLTATPIPRTLQMAFGQIRSLSLITTAPESRRPIKTMICHDDPGILKQAILQELERDGQIFFIHNRVKDIESVKIRLEKLVPQAKIVVGHGQMKKGVLEKVMLDFVSGKYHILLCTTIVESGLDIPRANTIIINRADRFGLAQLYQLRGRVGRASRQAYAYLVVPPTSMLTEDAKQRVETLTRYTDLGSGFSVATMDLEQRGAGNLIGPEQSGNVAAVGMEMFCELLENATRSLKGEKIEESVEPEVSLEMPGLLPDEYIPDIGQRLHLYKQLASAFDEAEVEQIAADMSDRFGKLPEETEQLISGMKVQSLCRRLNISGLEAGSKSMSIHLTPSTRISPDAIITEVRASQGRVRLTPELVVKIQFGFEDAAGSEGAIQFLHRIMAYDNNLSIS